MARWSCPAYTDREAKCTARFIEIYIETANKVNVPVILLEAGGVTKGCSKVTDILVHNKDIHIDLLLRNFWHIQFFNRKSKTICKQVKIINDGVLLIFVHRWTRKSIPKRVLKMKISTKIPFGPNTRGVFVHVLLMSTWQRPCFTNVGRPVN